MECLVVLVIVPYSLTSFQVFGDKLCTDTNEIRLLRLKISRLSRYTRFFLFFVSITDFIEPGSRGRAFTRVPVVGVVCVTLCVFPPAFMCWRNLLLLESVLAQSLGCKRAMFASRAAICVLGYVCFRLDGVQGLVDGSII